MSSSGDSPAPSRWLRRGARRLLHTRIFDVESVDFQHPARPAPKDFIVIHAPDWVNVVALTPERHLVLVRQFRFGSDEVALEIPGGVIDAGETPLEAAVRELREETGYVGSPARLLGRVRPNPAMQDNHTHLVLVTDARPTRALEWDDDEELAILTRPVEAVYAAAYAGEITHAMVLDALLLFRPHWEKLQRDGVI